MKEEEAKTKWCPFARRYAHCDNDGEDCSVGGTNREFNNKPQIGTLCIASDCMAWRWIERPGEQASTKGYCGLAGRLS